MEQLKDRSNDCTLKLLAVCKVTGMSTAWTHKEIAAGRFPSGFKITKKTRVWWMSDVIENMLARERGEISYDEGDQAA